MAFKSNLTALMNLFRLSNTDLARKIHVDASVISRWRSGKRAVSANSHHLYNLARFILSLPMTDYQAVFIDKLMSQALTGLDLQNNALRIKVLMDWLISEQTSENGQLDQEIFNHSPVAIAITRSGKIIYLNRTCLELFGYRKTSDMRGHRLAEFVTTDKAGDQVYGVRIDGQNFHAEIEVEPINLPDGPAQSNFIFDTSDRLYLESRYQQQLSAQELLLDIAKSFTRSYIENIDGLINKTLRRIGSFDGSERCFIYLFSDDMVTVSNTHEWCREGIESAQQAGACLDSADFPWFFQEITKKEHIYIPDVEDLPEEASSEMKFLVDFHVRSMLAIPIVQEAAVIGFMGFHAVSGDRLWTDEAISLLEFVAQIIANHLAQKKYYQNLKTSELYYKTMFNTGDAKVIVSKNEQLVLMANPQFVTLTGYDRQLIIGRPWQDFADRRSIVPIKSEQSEPDANADGLPERYKARIQSSSGRELFLQISASQIPGADEMLISLADQTEIYRLNRTLDAIRSCNSAIIKANNEHELLETVCQELVQTGGYALVWAGVVARDALQTVRPVVNIGANPDYVNRLQIFLNDPEHNTGPAALAITRNECQIIRDLEKTIQHPGWLRDIRQFGYKSLAALPFRLIDHDCSGVIVVYSDKPESFDDNEIELLQDLVSSLAFGINALHGKIGGECLKD